MRQPRVYEVANLAPTVDENHRDRPRHGLDSFSRRSTAVSVPALGAASPLQQTRFMYSPKTGLACALIVLGSAVSACPANEGSLEQAAEQVEGAGERVGDAFEKDGPFEKAGEKIDEAAGTRTTRSNELRQYRAWSFDLMDGPVILMGERRTRRCDAPTRRLRALRGSSALEPALSDPSALRGVSLRVLRGSSALEPVHGHLDLFLCESSMGT